MVSKSCTIFQTESEMIAFKGNVIERPRMIKVSQTNIN